MLRGTIVLLQNRQNIYRINDIFIGICAILAVSLQLPITAENWLLSSI